MVCALVDHFEKKMCYDIKKVPANTNSKLFNLPLFRHYILGDNSAYIITIILSILLSTNKNQETEENS